MQPEIAVSLFAIAENHLDSGELNETNAYANRSLDLARKFKLIQLICVNLNALAQVHENGVQARQTLQEGLELAQIHELQRPLAHIFLTLGELELAENNAENANKVLTRALDIMQRLKLRYHIPKTQRLLADCQRIESLKR